MELTLSRVTGIPAAIPNGLTKDVRFVLTVENGEDFLGVANYGIALQIASILGDALDLLRVGMDAQGGAVAIPAPDLREIRLQKTLLGDKIGLELITTTGIPHVFYISMEMAQSLAEDLPNALRQDRPVGRA